MCLYRQRARILEYMVDWLAASRQSRTEGERTEHFIFILFRMDELGYNCSPISVHPYMEGVERRVPSARTDPDLSSHYGLYELHGTDLTSDAVGAVRQTHVARGSPRDSRW